MRTSFIGFCGFIISGVLTLSAQDSPSVDYPPPSAPLVAPVPDKAQWTITIDYGNSTPAPPSPGNSNSNTSPPGTTNAAPLVNPGTEPLTEIRSVKTGNLKQDILVYKNRKPMEYWFVNDLMLAPGSGGGIVAFAARILIPVFDPNVANSRFVVERGNLIQALGFPGLDWVKTKYYDKVVLINKVPCYHYLFPLGSVPFAEAWINVKTKLPVQYAGDGVLYTFAFGPAPTADLVLPPAYADVTAAGQKFLMRSQLLESAVGH